VCQESGFMTKLSAFSFSFILLTVSLAGCLGTDEDDDSENDVLVCSEMEFTTHEVTISYIDYEYKSWGDSNQLFGILVIENSDLIYFEDATQVLANGQIYDLNPRGAPIRDTHTRFTVEYNEDNEDPRLDTNEGDVVCLIENPDGGTDLEWEKGRDCIIESTRLENGSYEHAEPMCNYILTEHLDRTSTIRGGIELPQNLEIEFCSNMTSVLNVYNGSIVNQYQNTSGYVEIVIDTTSNNTGNRWGSYVLRGGTDTITSSAPLEILQYSYTSTAAKVY